MKIHFDNVDFSSRTGPNSFGRRLAECLADMGHSIMNNGKSSDISLVFIETSGSPLANKVIQRLDGIWFSPGQFETHNSRIKSLYQAANAVVWQSEFDRKMTCKWWGDRRGSVIRNGVNKNIINDVRVDVEIKKLKQQYETVFVCSANWHGQKRLGENIRLFKSLREKYVNSCLLIMGNNPKFESDKDIFAIGSLPPEVCMQIFRSCDWMIHLSWLDHCPNTVIEALASNLPVICSEDGGTKEIVKNYGLILKEKERYQFDLVEYDSPPDLDLTQVSYLPSREDLGIPIDVSIESSAKAYIEIFEEVLR